MIVEFRLPDLGEGLEEAEIVDWLVAEGDEVGLDQPLVEVQTDKAVVEIPSPVAGNVARLAAAPGEIIRVGEVLVAFESSEPGPVTAATDKTGAHVAQPEVPAGPATEAPQAAAVDGGREPPGAPVGGGRRRAKAAPAVRRLAHELGVDLASVSGSGSGGRVLADDLRRASEAAPDGQRTAAPTAEAEGPAPRAVPAADITGNRVPLRGIRRRTAEVMTQAWSTIPHITGMDEVDVTALLAAHRAVQRAEGEDGLRVTLVSFFVKAAGQALRRFPMVNASIDVDAGEIVQHERCNVGVAAATPTGLVVPVVRDADRRSLRQIAEEVARLTTSARSGSLTVEDLQGGTFTTTNYGALGGGRFATPIIRPPEVAIIGFGGIADRPVAVDGEVVVRPVLPYSFSADHRLIDGDLAGSFTRYLVGLLADPVTMLVDA